METIYMYSLLITNNLHIAIAALILGAALLAVFFKRRKNTSSSLALYGLGFLVIAALIVLSTEMVIQNAQDFRSQPLKMEYLKTTNQFIAIMLMIEEIVPVAFTIIGSLLISKAVETNLKAQ